MTADIPRSGRFPEPANRLFNPVDFGAKGDGASDDTLPIQQAIDAAAQCGGVVVFRPGVYVTGELHLHHGSSLRGELCNRYGYKDEEPCVRLQLREDDTSKSLLNISEARGTRIFGLDLFGLGAEHPRKVHGILLDHAEFGPAHDSPVIDSCQIRRFSGDGCFFNRVFVLSLRFTSISGNGGCGINAYGWDGFITDCTLTGSHDAGLRLRGASYTVTANRIEWNRKGGVVLDGSSHINLTGNYIDRSGLLGISMRKTKITTCTGNLIYRSGKVEWQNDEPLDSAHVRITDCSGVVFSGNTFCAGRDDNGMGIHSPDYGLIIGGNRACVIKGNTLADSCLKQTIVDLGGNTDCAIGDNPGFLRTLPPEQKN